ncbi:MAG: glycosyltransferase [Herbinix sp.]|nr:glycosyltransferase [Herbinix sp.]
MSDYIQNYFLNTKQMNNRMIWEECKVKQSPSVSIIMPTFNRENIIYKAIDSVINQNYQNWELIVVDDRSTDNTKKIIKSYIEKDCRIKYILNTQKKGPAGARNCGIYNSNGKYIAFLDSDDEWFEHHLSTCVNALENENVDICSALWIENCSGNLIKVDKVPELNSEFEKAFKTLNPKIKGDMVFFDEKLFEYSIKKCFYCYHINTIVLNRTIIDSIGVFKEGLRASEDIDFLYRIFNNYNLCLINDYHFIYNEGQDNIYRFMDRNNIDVQRIIDDSRLVEKLNLNGINKNNMWKNLKKIVKVSLKTKDKKECIKIINNRIALKYFTLSFINIKNNRIKSIYYYLYAFIYKCDIIRFSYLLRLLKPYKVNIDASTYELDFW